jgi:hypothetical protein
MNSNNDSYWSSRDSGKASSHDNDDWDYDDDVETQPKDDSNNIKKQKKK